MSYDKALADRLREALAALPDGEEKEMFSGVCFMVNGKMCICVSRDNLLCRIGAAAIETAAELNGCKQAMMGGRTMKDYVYVSPEGFASAKDFNHWVQLSLAFNPKAKASKKKS
jgi:TfoX/Sxy family transcriptional regulator of competence genes